MTRAREVRFLVFFIIEYDNCGMRFTFPVEEYRRQLEAYTELESISFKPEDSREYIISKLEQRSEKKRAISDITNKIIFEYVETFELHPEWMTLETANRLEEFENVLFPQGKRVGEVGATDYGIYYRIAKILAAYYRKEGTISQYATALNCCSLGHMMLINGHSYHWQLSPYHTEVLRLAKKLHEEPLSDEARQKVLVNLVRSSFSIGREFDIDGLETVLRILQENFHSPHTDFEMKILESFFDTVIQMFREYCFFAKEDGREIEREKVRPLLEKACKFLTDLPNSMAHSMDAANIMMTEYFLGALPLEDVLDGLSKLQQNAEKDENPFRKIQGLATFSGYYLKLLHQFSDLPKEEVFRLSQQRIHEVLPKLLSVSHLANNVQFNRYIVEFLDAASLTGSFDEFAPIILESTVYADKPLFIHTVMVRELSKVIFDYLFERDPAFFDGVAGKDASYIQNHKEEMRNLLSECCMYHDIGKFFMLDVVENSMRRLTEDEFALIQEHPTNFDYVFKASDQKDDRVNCIRDCALAHHRWHDGSRGYPDVALTENRPFVDILALTDSMDAATDYLGRPYYDGKTIEELITEFQQRSGTQYGPEVVEALSDPSVRRKLQYWVTEGRKEIYYQIYAFNEIRSLDETGSTLK